MTTERLAAVEFFITLAVLVYYVASCAMGG